MALARASIVAAAGTLLLGALGCSEDPDRPPPFVATPPGDLRGCAELRARGELAGTEFTIDGRRASCAVNGLKCPIAQAAAVLARCDGGTGEASCNATIWTLACLGRLDASADSGFRDGP